MTKRCLIPSNMNSFVLPSFLNSYHIKYTIFPSLALLIIAIISVNPKNWVTSDVHHFYFEIIAVVLSAIVGFYCITRAYTLNEKFTLFVGVGFLTVTVIDFLHAALSFNAAGDSTFLRYFIPQTWFAGRTFLGAMLVYAVLRYSPTSPSENQSASQRQNLHKNDNKDLQPVIGDNDSERLHASLLFSLVVFSILAISVVVVSFFSIFPNIVSNYFIHRPYEIPSLFLFSLALAYFYKKRLYKINDVFYKGLLGALIIDIFGQAIMSLSGMNFDTAHNISHILKICSLFVIVSSLAISSIQYNKILKQREKVILDQYEELKEADIMKDEFIKIAAHELRTPIQPILSTTDILKSKTTNEQEQELLDITIRNAKRLQGLADNILDVSKIESRSFELNLEFHDLNDIIINVINDLVLDKKFTNKKGVKLIYEPKTIFVNVDKVRLTQVISNLLNNAIKNTTEGSISVEAQISDGKAVVSVKDTGKGIDPEVYPKLFSKFATKSTTGGTGLGLFISKSIIDAHGGKIWVENNPIGDGLGTVFKFTLPLNKFKRKLDTNRK
jgi:signal transduction histidine kinase